MQKLFLYCHYHVLYSLQIELFLQGQLHYNVLLCQNGFNQFFLYVLNLERPWLHMKKLFHRELECYAFLFFIPLKCHFMILCILQNVYTIIVDHKIQMYISFYLGVVPKVMSATLNVVVSINSTTVMQTYWTASKKNHLKILKILCMST